MDKTTKQRLVSYRALRLEVDNQLDRLARLRNEEQIPAMQESSGAKSTGGNGDRMERAILRRMEYEERVAPQIEAAKREMAAIEAAIDHVEDPLERECLRLRYISGDGCRMMPWKDVAVALFGDDEECYILSVFRLHKKALEHVGRNWQKENTAEVRKIDSK